MSALQNNEGSSRCHYCTKQLVFSKKPFDFSFIHADPEIQEKVKKRRGDYPRYYCVELLTPGEPSYVVRVHKQCVAPALEDGYKRIPNECRRVSETVVP